MLLISIFIHLHCLLRGFRIGDKSPLFCYTVYMIDKEKIKQAIQAYIADNNLFIIDIKVHPNKQIKVFIDSFNGIFINQCAEISRILDNNFMDEIREYDLEVSSPGLDEPLKLKEQYQKNQNREIELLLFNGVKKEALLVKVNKDGIEVEEDKVQKQNGRKKSIKINKTYYFKEIKEAKVVIRI